MTKTVKSFFCQTDEPSEGAARVSHGVDKRRRRVRGSVAVLGLAVLASGLSAGQARADDQAACDPYKDYSCLDGYLGNGVFERLANYYTLEIGHDAAPADPSAPAGRRDYWPSTPEATPPMPFTEWPYGGTSNLGVTRPNVADSPLMEAIANTSTGQWMSEHNIQFYGWIDPGFNVSSNSVRPGGNAPIAYAYTPNTIQLDQLVGYLERVPDTVQNDHVDWGFRLSGLYGENYRYTTGFGYSSYQLLKANQVNGYDYPMEYLDLFIPQVAEGLYIRAGRYISLPDIEAQLAPNNYMYTHSFTYAFDNYTNTGIQTSLALTKDLIVQLGVSDGTEAAPWHLTASQANPLKVLPASAGFGANVTNPLYSGNTFPKDPGAQPSLTACVRYNWNDGRDDTNICANGINDGRWGYNNLQWYGFTYYHKFNDHWHLAAESYYEEEERVPNNRNAEAMYIYENGGTPFSPQYMPALNGPAPVYCKDPNSLKCSAHAVGVVSYLNYSPDTLNNFSLRPEYYYDPNGWRTGTGVPSYYYALSLGWQHWLSPQIEFRPEIGYYRSLGVKAFNVCPANSTCGTGGTSRPADYTVFAGGDMILHF
jgi:hypothetical protein